MLAAVGDIKLFVETNLFLVVAVPGRPAVGDIRPFIIFLFSLIVVKLSLTIEEVAWV